MLCYGNYYIWANITGSVSMMLVGFDGKTCTINSTSNEKIGELEIPTDTIFTRYFSTSDKFTLLYSGGGTGSVQGGYEYDITFILNDTY